MVHTLQLEELSSIDENIQELAELLKQVVDEGASIGFLPPMNKEDAIAYWENLLQPDVIVFVAKIHNKIAGSVQLHISSKQNGTHRAEIGKLMTHPHFRRNGVGRLLMQKAEERAKQENRSLLLLDTREGDPSNKLYTSLDFVECGKIPKYARSANGELHTTVLYYKLI